MVDRPLTVLNSIHSSVSDLYHLIQYDEGCLQECNKKTMCNIQ